jgi:hypothetical protein
MRRLTALSTTIPTRTLGKTGLKLPILGYCGAALPKAWLNPLTTEQRVELGLRVGDIWRRLLCQLVNQIWGW